MTPLDFRPLLGELPKVDVLHAPSDARAPGGWPSGAYREAPDEVTLRWSPSRSG
jgi:hypothetical protein